MTKILTSPMPGDRAGITPGVDRMRGDQSGALDLQDAQGACRMARGA